MCTFCDSTNINTIIAIETITADILQTVWNELDFHVDVCRIIKGDVHSTYKVCNKNLECCLLNKKNT